MFLCCYQMGTGMNVLKYLWVGVVGAIAGAIASLFLLPLWRKLEILTGVEMVGHSGPASWIILFSMGVFACAGIGLLAYKLRDKS